jgi:hypothetical protein
MFDARRHHEPELSRVFGKQVGRLARRLCGIHALERAIENLLLLRTEVGEIQEMVDEDAETERCRDATR